MYLLPAIDILGGKAVRLAKGDYNQVTVYNDDPVAQAVAFEEAGADWVHVVDLDGARSGVPENIAIIEAIARKTLLKIEVGGGIRSLDTVQRLVDAGVSRVVMGTVLVKDPALAEEAIKRFGDVMCAGIDARDGEVAVDGAGTVECLTPIYDSMPDIAEMYKGYFSVVPYVIPGKYVAYAFSYTGGALIDWCVSNLAKDEKRSAKARGLSVNELLEHTYRQEHGAEPSGLLVLPHFAGAATPYMDTGAKGAILGLTTDTGAPEIYRGCMEGVVYEMVLNARALKDSGVHFKKLHATGGGARSSEWMQMKADMLNLPIVALKTADAGTVGSAMLTGVAIGAFADLKDAADHMVEEIHTYEPRPEMHEKYMKIYARYERVYQAVRPLM